MLQTGCYYYYKCHSKDEECPIVSVVLILNRIVHSIVAYSVLWWRRATPALIFICGPSLHILRDVILTITSGTALKISCSTALIVVSWSHLQSSLCNHNVYLDLLCQCNLLSCVLHVYPDVDWLKPVFLVYLHYFHVYPICT